MHRQLQSARIDKAWYETITWHAYTYISHMKSSCTHEWVMPLINESCRIYEWVMSHMNEACRIWMSHVTYDLVVSHKNELCHIKISSVTYKIRLYVPHPHTHARPTSTGRIEFDWRIHTFIQLNWCCFCDSIRNSLVALLETWLIGCLLPT